MGRYRTYAPKFNRGRTLYDKRSLAVNQVIELKTFDTFVPQFQLGDTISGSQLGNCAVFPTRVGVRGSAATGGVVTLPASGEVTLNAVPQGVTSWAREGRKINMTALNIAFRATCGAGTGYAGTGFANFGSLGRFHFAVVLDTQFNNLAGETGATLCSKVFSSGYIPGDPAATNVNDIVFRHPDYLSRFRVLFHKATDWKIRLNGSVADNVNNAPSFQPIDEQVSIPLKGMPVTFGENQTLSIAGDGTPTSTLTPGGSITDNGIFLMAWQSGGCLDTSLEVFLAVTSRLYYTG